MSNTHKIHHFHALRVVLFGVLLIAVSIVRIDANALPSLTKQSVLAYATSMSRGDLFAAANASRSANGLGAFSLNGQLNNSAQAKAQHMADNNYWAHVAPDGTQPWYFFEAAGYNYSRAGENLAYGFSTSYATNDGWMNSSSHRANILGDYAEVGFGIVNSHSFQGGENTIVVAHYGTQVAYTPPPPAPTPTPTPSPAATTAAPSSQSNQSLPTAATPPAPVNERREEDVDQSPVPNDAQTEAAAAVVPIATGVAKNVSVLETFRTSSVPSVALASLTLTLVTAFGYALTHRAMMRHAFTTGEHFVVTHPTFDAVTLFLALSLILTTTAARLQ